MKWATHVLWGMMVQKKKDQSEIEQRTKKQKKEVKLSDIGE